MADNTIDSLNIEITAGVTDAVKAVQRAKRNLKGLEDVISRVDKIKANFTTLKNFSEVMKGLSNLEEVTESVKIARRRIRSLETLVLRVSNIKFDDSGIGEFTKSMKQLAGIGGGERMTAAVANIRALANAKAFQSPLQVPEPPQTIEDIRRITDAAYERYKNRNQNLRKTGPIASGGSAVDWDEVKRDQAAVEEYINVYAAGMDKLGKKTKKNAALFDELAKKAWAASERVREMYGVEVQTQTNRFSDMIKNLRKQLGFSGDIKSSGLVDKLKEISALLFEKKTRSRYGMLSMLGRSLMFSTFYRGISLVTQGLREGTDNLYQYSKAAGSAFAPALDAMSTSMLYLKNSIAAAAAPLIQTLSPAIDFIVDKIVSFTNVLNQLFAKLSGASTWTRATKIQKDYADALGDTASEAKKAKNILVGFDELNIFDPVSGDSSSKFTGANPDPTTMFEEMDISTVNADISKFADKIKEIATSVTEEFENVKEKIGNVMDFLGIDFNDILTTVGAVGAAILGWKLAQDFVSGIAALASTVAALKVPISLALSIGGLKLFSDNLDELIAGNGDWKNVIGAVLGASMNIAGMTWLFGTSGLVISLATLLELSGWKLIKDAVNRFKSGEGGWTKWIEAGVGAALIAGGVILTSLMFGPAGLVLGIGTVVAIAITDIIRDKNKETANITAQINKQLDDVFANHRYNRAVYVDLTTRINQNVVDFTEIQTNLALIQEKVDAAFALNDIPVEERSSYEAERLKQLVEDLQGSNIKITVDEEGSIANSRAEVQGMIEDLKQMYEVRALGDLWTESLKNQYEAQAAVKKASDDLATANDTLEEAQKALYDKMPDWVKSTLGVRDASEVTSDALSLVHGGSENLLAILTTGTGLIDTLKRAEEGVENARDDFADLYEVEKEATQRSGEIKDAMDKLISPTKDSAAAVKNLGDNLSELKNAKVDIDLNVDTRELDNAIEKMQTTFQVKGVQKSNARYNSDRYQAMASGGVAYRPTHALIGEYAGASSNPEIVTPQDLMFETMVRANEASNAGTNALLRKILNAVEESGGGETTVTITTADVVAALDRKNRRVGKTVVPVAVN